MTRTPTGRRPESGFALLVIFLIAAAVAFTMYQELPRAAFESARDKEQLLLDRGNQYKRAIQVFYAVNKRYPAEIKDLENTNDKRFLRRRYIDPMTGQDQWRLIHTNGSFLTDSLVKKPPAENAGNGLPGAGQTPGGGPLGANNLNTAPAAPTPGNSASNPNDPAAAAVPAPLNSAAQRRPSDRGFPTGPGFPQPPGAFNPGNQNPFGANPANFNPDDPSTWPPITLATPTAQPAQPQQGVAQRPGQPAVFQPQPQGGLGQLGGQGGANPQPASLSNPNPFAQNSLTAAPVADPLTQNTGVPNPNQFTINSDGQLTPFGNQPAPVPQPQQPPPQQPFNGSQPFNAGQLGNLAAAGFNPQNPTPPQPTAAGGQPNPALPGNTSGNPFGNPALNAIDNALFRPNQAPATGPTGSPGIAGVASKFEGSSIKAYRERTKYQEWEFVYEPAVNQPGANQAGQAGAPGQNPQPNQNGLGQNPLGPNPPGQGSGQTQTPGANSPFSQPNPFSPQAPTR